MIMRPMQNIFKPVLDSLREGDILKAHSLGLEILQDNLDNEDVIFLMRTIDFWKDKLKSAVSYSSAFESGIYMVSEWKPFLNYISKKEEYDEAVTEALKFCVFKLAMGFYSEFFKENPEIEDAELYRKTGICCKVLGNYEKAIELLEYAMHLDSDSPSIAAELADCYAMCGETRLAKIFFREAFFKDAAKVEIQFLESGIICSIINKLEAKGFKDKELLEWIPVQAVLDGVFNIKRELKALELGTLKQNIFLLESELKSKPEYQKKLDIPRLINYYFWLVDHYSNMKDNKFRIDEILLKIKILDEDIYNSYIR